MSLGIGTTLSEARQARGLELADVHSATKIRIRSLQALEAEEWDMIPGPAYVRGFLTAYAEVLGLDPEPLLKQLNAEYFGRQEELPERIIEPGGLPVPRRANLVWAGLAAALVAVVALVLILSGGEEPGDENGGIDERSGQSVPEAKPPQSAPESPIATPRAEQVSIELRADGEVWICLVDQRGRELIAGETLAAGQRRGPFESRRFSIALGNGQIRIKANGEAIEIPNEAEPIGFEIGSDGAKRLETGASPDCA